HRAHANRPGRRAAGRPGPVHRSDLQGSRVSDPESLHHGIPAHHGDHAASIPGPAVTGGAGSGKGGREMTAIEGVMPLIRQASGVDIGSPPPCLKAGDPDAVLVQRLRGRMEGAAEALVAAYGDRVYRLATRISTNSADAEEVVQDALWAVI